MEVPDIHFARSGDVNIACRRFGTGRVGVAVCGGLHTGEVTVRDDGDVTGLAVNLASHVDRAATDGTIYASSTVRDLLLGGDRSCEYRGEHELRGIEDSWRLYEQSA